MVILIKTLFFFFNFLKTIINKQIRECWKVLGPYHFQKCDKTDFFLLKSQVKNFSDPTPTTTTHTLHTINISLIDFPPEAYMKSNQTSKRNFWISVFSLNSSKYLQINHDILFTRKSKGTSGQSFMRFPELLMMAVRSGEFSHHLSNPSFQKDEIHVIPPFF